MSGPGEEDEVNKSRPGVSCQCSSVGTSCCNTSLNQILVWTPVRSDQECIPRIRMVSSSSEDDSHEDDEEDEDDDDDDDSSDSSHSSEVDGNKSPEKEETHTTERKKSLTIVSASGQGRGKDWSDQPLSIMWCLNAFDEQIKESAASEEHGGKPRVLVYSRRTVCGLNNEAILNQLSKMKSEMENAIVAQENEPRPSRADLPKQKHSRKRQCHKCQSSDSIDSSPTSYRDDTEWTGYKLKRQQLKKRSSKKMTNTCQCFRCLNRDTSDSESDHVQVVKVVTRGGFSKKLKRRKKKSAKKDRQTQTT